MAGRLAADKKLVLMMCGIAGSGKTTYSKAIVAGNPTLWSRLSIDEIIYEKHGMFDKDYPASQYSDYQAEADSIMRKNLREWLEQDSSFGHGMVLDRSFWRRSDRDEFRNIIQHGGGTVELAYLEANVEVLWTRICARSANGRDANSALEISRELLDDFVDGFEKPGVDEHALQIGCI